MKKRMTIQIAACAAIAVGASLPLCAAELAHRWSFNGDFADSVGGAEAVRVGDRVSLYGDRLHLGGYSYKDVGYVVLGTNSLDTAEATIEIWARHDSVRKWSRIFDYGADTDHYFTLCWTRGVTLAADRAGAKNGTETPVDNTMAPYEIGVDYHIAVTFKKNGDATDINWQRRDAATGELQKFGSATMSGGIHSFADPVLYLGHSQYWESGDRDARAAYDEVRLWRGVMTDEQLAASAKAGPDAAISVVSETPQFTAAPTPEPPEQRVAMPDGGFRIMTYNIRTCYDDNNVIVPERTAARILAENPDFCCINEVNDSDQFAEGTVLAKLTGMHKTYFGNMILSKEEPIGEPEKITLPMSTEGYGTRYCMICEFTNFCVAVTHLDTTAKGRDDSLVQASNTVAIATIRDAFARYTKPVFLCGDWNTRPDWDNMARFNEFLEILSPTNGVRTYHGQKATGGYILDYISVDRGHRDDFFVQSAFVVEDTFTSDHNPVIAELYRRPAASALGWVDESFLTTGRTGTWSPSVAWNGDTWTAELGGGHAFVPTTPSGGNVVAMTTTVTFDCVPQEEVQPKEGAQGGLWIGTNGCFQVWTRRKLGVGSGGEGELGWVDVEAEGETPQVGVEYTFRFTFDYISKTYGVEVQTATGFTRLREKNPVNPVNPVQNFPLATPGSKISRIRFDGSGAFRSLVGEWAEKVRAFMIHIL